MAASCSQLIIVLSMRYVVSYSAQTRAAITSYTSDGERESFFALYGIRCWQRWDVLVESIHCISEHMPSYLQLSGRTCVMLTVKWTDPKQQYTQQWVCESPWANISKCLLTTQVLKLHMSLAPYKVAVLPKDRDNSKLCMVKPILSTSACSPVYNSCD